MISDATNGDGAFRPAADPPGSARESCWST